MISQANARHIPLADESVHMCMTSPPYWGLRDYGLATWEGGDAGCDHLGPPKSSGKSTLKNDGRPMEMVGQNDYERGAVTPFRETCGKCGAVRHDSGIGLEKTPEEYVANIVAAFREVWRVLRDDGTLWLNMGDCYTGGANTGGAGKRAGGGVPYRISGLAPKLGDGLKPKDLVGMPWRVAFALQADGWYLRSDIIWHKTNPMPERVRDRPTKAHEYLFLLAKQPRYFYDAQAIAESGSQTSGGWQQRAAMGNRAHGNGESAQGRGLGGVGLAGATRNRRDVWTIPTSPYKGAHFATFPPKLVEPCVLAGSPIGGIVFDPFCGSGTVGQVCRLHGRRFVGLDLSLKYLRELALPRAEGKQRP